MNVPFLGRLPFDPRLVECADAGESYLDKYPDSEMSKAYNQIVNTIVQESKSKTPQAASPAKGEKVKKDGMMKVAIPIAEGKLTAHFGHAAEFVVLDVEDREIKKKESMEPPPHEPGVLPRWLRELGVDVIIAGGMGQRALSLFEENGIKVITGAPSLTPEELLHQYLSDSLVTGGNICDH
jgi:ATP-binding protein involved in chromosome partitioning